MAQNTIFHQVVKLIPRNIFQEFVSKHGSDRGVRVLDSWTWFGSLLFSQLSGHDSIRAIEQLFSKGDHSMRSLGFSKISRSTLSDANRTRGVGLLEDLFKFLLEQAQQMRPARMKHSLSVSGKFVALDSTLTPLALSLCPWAKYKSNEAAAKVHVGVDLAGHLPEFVVIQGAGDKGSFDSVAARENYRPERVSTTVADRAYFDAEFLKRIDAAGAFFVVRARNHFGSKCVRSFESNRTLGVLCDQEIYLSGKTMKKKYKGTLRRVRYRCPETQKEFEFVTNRFDLAATTIAKIYKARWEIELFFKTLKQHLRIKKFLGLTENAVKAQIWVAMIAYLLVQILRFSVFSQGMPSMPDTMALIATLLLMKYPIKQLLEPMRRINSPPPIQERLFHFQNF